MSLADLGIDHDWTLFLDRDGVINHRIPGDYIRTWDQFEFLPGSINAIASLSNAFGRIVVVTNQQGIGKGLMNADDVHHIHACMTQAIADGGGRVDAIYHCPHLAGAGCDCRKPATGMARAAQCDHPAIDFSRSLMAGDSDHDVAFGHAVGMITVGLGDRIAPGLPEADYFLAGLPQLADAISR